MLQGYFLREERFYHHDLESESYAAAMNQPLLHCSRNLTTVPADPDLEIRKGEGRGGWGAVIQTL